MQKIIDCYEGYGEFQAYLKQFKNIFLVSGKNIQRFAVSSFLPDFNLTSFTDFNPNPDYDSIIHGVEMFKKGDFDVIMAIGGGSVIDTAKFIKLYAGNKLPDGEKDSSYLLEKPRAAEVPLIALPTTAGTGSEATRFSVIYYKGSKQSITDDRILPDTVVFDANVLNELPEYQRKATLSDALCHAIESYWSVNSTAESRKYSGTAIRKIKAYANGYINNNKEGNRGMLEASNIAGRAINISQTTAGHAMSYKLTSVFGCAHGHAAILCDRVLYKWMVERLEDGSAECADPRGEDYLKNILTEIAQEAGFDSAMDGANRLSSFFDSMGLEVPVASEEQLVGLRDSVNPERLKNHPVKLDSETLLSLYKKILRA